MDKERKIRMKEVKEMGRGGSTVKIDQKEKNVDRWMNIWTDECRMKDLHFFLTVVN